jgi:UDP-glucose 4-epimerase
VGPVGVIAHAGEIVRQITDSTYAVVDLARRHGAKLVDVSTSEVYGGGQQGLCSEDMPRIVQADTTVRLEYAVAKLAMETALINTTKVSDLQAVIVRPFNVAGPRQKAAGGFVLPRFVGQALRGEPLTIYGNGCQIRAFTHVADIVDGLILAMEKGRSGEVYNLGNPANRTTINRLASEVITLVGGEQVKYLDPKSLHGPLYAEAADKYPSAEKAKLELGWNPLKGLSETIADVYDFMRNAGEESVSSL